ncbi:MAG: hypothetical protein WAZ77_16100, partial [Candidatus Nitrosopolaris sp.]
KKCGTRRILNLLLKKRSINESHQLTTESMQVSRHQCCFVSLSSPGTIEFRASSSLVCYNTNLGTTSHLLQNRQMSCLLPLLLGQKPMARHDDLLQCVRHI